MKIYSQLYWKEHCFGLSAEGIVDKAVELNNVGGTFGGTKKVPLPSAWLSAVLTVSHVLCSAGLNRCVVGLAGNRLHVPGP